MAQWECIVCGWIYDEAKGDPENGVAPGTKWADVPVSWLCPDCCVGKEDFELIAGSDHDEDEIIQDNAADEVFDEDHHPIIIIGSGLAGYNLIKEFRKHDKETPAIIITNDDGRNYSKPMLSTGFTRGKEANDLSMGDAGSMAKQYDCSVWTMTTVTAINTDQQTITVGASTSISYRKLVIAWGADVIQPPIGGNALDQIYAINDLLDYDTFRQALKKSDAKKVAIIGGGLIGSEFTNDLLNGGFKTETIDPLGWPIASLLPEPVGKALQTELEAKGAVFHFGPVASEVNTSNNSVTVTLNNGKTIDADIVVSAVGVRPRTALAEAAGITVNRGIVANRLLETSASHVYTLGDCAEVDGHVLYYVQPLMACAKALAQTLAGEPTEVSYPAMPVTIKVPASPVAVSPPAHGAEGEWRITQNDNNVIAEFRNIQGDLLGFAVTGEDAVKEKMRLQKELPAIMP